MFEAISSFVATHAVIFGIVSVVVSLVVLFSQQRMQFWWCDFWVTFPIVGTIARLSKITDKGNNGWMAAEEKLCAVYKPFISLMPESKFNQRIEYMRNTGDLGRTPMTLGLKIFLFLLVAAEGLGFSYILGSWIARDGSANTLNIFMFVIVLVLASILAMVTHKAGEQYYKTTLLRSCFKRYKETEGKEYASGSIALSGDQWSDKNQPDYTRCINRIASNPHDKGSYSAVWVAIVAIIVIAIASTVMRWKNLDSELTRESAQQTQVSSGNPFADAALPAEVSAPQKEADKKAQSEVTANTKVEGMSAFLMLGFIFVLTQIVGISAGYKHSFAGKETYKKAAGTNSFWFWSQMDGAYADTGGFSTYDSYWQTFEPLVDLVNGRLKDLQQRLKQNSHENLKLTKTFLNYLEEQQVNTNAARANLDRVHVAYSAETTQKTTPAQESTIALDKAKDEIAAISEKQAQIEYFSGLPTSIQEELKPWLKQRKAEEQAKQQADLNELF